MFNLIRRGGSASFSRSLRTLATPLSQKSIVSRVPIRHELLFQGVPRTRALHSASRLLQQSARAFEADEVAEEQDADTLAGTAAEESPQLVTKFEDLGKNAMVDGLFVKALVGDMRLETMTPVQSQTINAALGGDDVLAQARTGTGKTIAFLLPLLQRIVNQDAALLVKNETTQQRRASSRPDIRALIISPTRELAEQIAAEARRLTSHTKIKVQTAVGGTNKLEGLRKIQYEGCHVLIGTPGRLNDLLSDPRSRVDVPKLNALVLDEADRLLDAGFAPEIENIRNLLPDETQVPRQNLMFSATVPREVMKMVKTIMKPGFQFVQTIQPGEVQTHDRVPQKIVETVGFENMMPALAELINRELERPRGPDDMPFKAIVFFNASAEATLAHQMYRHLKNPDSNHPIQRAVVVEMHARLTQNQRTKNSDLFRRSKSAIMFCSDVVARGMDFPNVTHVIQMGLPSTRDTYIHRIGRTGRSNKGGEGWLFITPLETREVRSRLTKLPIKPDHSIQAAQVDMTKDADLPISTAKILTEISDASKLADPELKAGAYRASLGVFQWYPHKQQLVDSMNKRAKYQWGMSVPPPINPLLAQRLGLSRITGINMKLERSRPNAFESPRSSNPYKSGESSRGRRPGFSRDGRSGPSPDGRVRFTDAERRPRMRFS